MLERTQVGIVGAGPAGLMLSHLLHLAGIESVVLERRSRKYVESRVRAGVLEDGAAEMLRSSGVGERMDREGLVHGGIYLQFGGERHRIDFMDLVGRGIMVYGQQEVVKDLIEARLATGGDVRFETEVRRLDGLGGEPSISYLHDGVERLLACDFVAGCDGAHGVGRMSLPAGSHAAYERVYPHAWLGILARTPPASEELIYARHERGFALHSMRSPDMSRLYLQVDGADDPGSWPPNRIWDELRLRLNEPTLQEGEIVEIGVTEMRSLVLEPIQYGKLFLAGDAAHIVPPTGAKGMNLALADVRALAAAVAKWYTSGSSDGLDGYSENCLQRAWRAQHFSAFMTSLLHGDAAKDPFEHKLQLANLTYIARSRAAATALAENYTSAATGVWGSS
ncbi:MAG TPA: 4-hydroxybenzoate 3-monooxygenase [Candidatus Dormibacteraeota bacterium]